MESLEERIARAVREEVAIVPHDARWAELFRSEEQHLRTCLPRELIGRIEHFGSTAVPGLAAKPIIDMLIEVSDLEATKRLVVPVLEGQGYEYFWRPTNEADEPYYAWFIKRDARTGSRTHHLHFVEGTFREHWDRLLFRDYLILHPNRAKEYGELKLLLATTTRHDRVAYGKQKASFIREVTERARRSLREV